MIAVYKIFCEQNSTRFYIVWIGYHYMSIQLNKVKNEKNIGLLILSEK